MDVFIRYPANSVVDIRAVTSKLVSNETGVNIGGGSTNKSANGGGGNGGAGGGDATGVVSVVSHFNLH